MHGDERLAYLFPLKFTRFAKKDSAKHFHLSICYGAAGTRTAKIIIVFILTIRCGTLQSHLLRFNADS